MRSPGSTCETRSSSESRYFRLFCAVPMLLGCSLLAILFIAHGGSGGLKAESELLSGIDGYLINKYGDDEDALKAYGFMPLAAHRRTTTTSDRLTRAQAPPPNSENFASLRKKMMQSMLHHYDSRAESSMSNIGDSGGSEKMDFPAADKEDSLLSSGSKSERAASLMDNNKRSMLHDKTEERKHSVDKQPSPTWKSLAKSLYVRKWKPSHEATHASTSIKQGASWSDLSAELKNDIDPNVREERKDLREAKIRAENYLSEKQVDQSASGRAHVTQLSLRKKAKAKNVDLEDSKSENLKRQMANEDKLKARKYVLGIIAKDVPKSLQLAFINNLESKRNDGHGQSLAALNSQMLKLKDEVRRMKDKAQILELQSEVQKLERQQHEASKPVSKMMTVAAAKEGLLKKVRSILQAQFNTLRENIENEIKTVSASDIAEIMREGNATSPFSDSNELKKIEALKGQNAKLTSLPARQEGADTRAKSILTKYKALVKENADLKSEITSIEMKQRDSKNLPTNQDVYKLRHLASKYKLEALKLRENNSKLSAEVFNLQSRQNTPSAAALAAQKDGKRK